MITRFGSITLGVAIPSVPQAIAQLSALLGQIGSDLAQVQATFALTINVPLVADYTAALTAAISGAASALAELPAEAVTVHAGLSAQISALIALQSAAQAVLSLLQGAVSVGGFLGYSWSGVTSTVGAELQAAVTADIAPAASGNAFVLVTTSPSAWTSAGVLLKTS